jgi:hypothetical protein
MREHGDVMLEICRVHYGPCILKWVTTIHRQHIETLSLDALSLSPSLSPAHTHALSLSHSLKYSMHTHTHTLSLSLSLSLSNTHTQVFALVVEICRFQLGKPR